MSMFEPGETVTLIGDVFPGNVTQVVDGVQVTPSELPQNTAAILFRVLITTRGLVVGYQFGGDVHRVELPVPEADTTEATYRGGVVGPYEVTARGDCRCKARMLSTWDLSQIFPGHPVVTEARTEKVAAAVKADPNYGLIPSRGPVRYSMR